MLLVEWRPKARKFLWRILDYIGDRNPHAADRLYESIETATEALPGHPSLYRPNRVPGTREIVVHPNYLVIYRVTSSPLEILDVLHARQEYPP